MKAVLLGDSIRLLGYGKKTAELLSGKMEVWQSGDNNRFALYTLRCLFDNDRQIRGSDIVHFNCGLWDVCQMLPDGEPFVTIDEYVNTIKRIVKNLRLQNVKKIIFSTTTPCGLRNPYNKNNVIEDYNAAIVPVLKELDVEIIDLYSLLADNIEKYIRNDDQIHLTDDGIDACAQEVANAILRVADELK